MLKELMHDPIFLAGKSEVATKEDLQVAQDLLDTLIAHRESCVGMAANMIGVRKRIIAFLDESGRAPTYTVMLNPEIIKKDGAYDTEEGCLSLLGGPRKCKRYKTIKVQYQTLDMQTRTKNFTGWTAQILGADVTASDASCGGETGEGQESTNGADRPKTAEFKPYQPKYRKRGTGSVHQVSKNVWEGRYTPTVNGKRIARNIYADSEEECEIKLEALIKEMKAEFGIK